MKTIKHLATILLAFIAVTATAQNAEVTGLLINAGQFSPVDIMQYARNNYSSATARTAAMGGAFTALSGDMGSITMNPAGMAGSVWGFSPSIIVNESNNPFESGKNSKTKFTINQIGTVLNVFNSRDYSTSINIGFTYNRLADFNYRGNMTLPSGSGGSILNIFQQQLNGLYNYMDHGRWDPISESDLRLDPYGNENIYVDEWGAVLGYQSGLFPADRNGYYGITGLPDNGVFSPSLQYESSGNVGEYNIAGNININDIFSVGVSFGFQDITQNLTLSYSESYDDNQSGTAQQYLKQMRYNQYVHTSGSTFNFKIGAIVKPFSFLRLGIAFHTPSYTSLYKEYNAGMGTQRFGSTESYHSTYSTGWNYSYRTAPRLLTGAALLFGNNVAISFDYERVWYNKMRYTGGTFEMQDNFRNAIESDYKPANNFRVGLEIKPMQQLALRLGYAYYDTPIKEKTESGDPLIFKNIFTTSSYNISAGIGIWLGKRTSLDLAYVFSQAKIAPYDLYYYNGPAKFPTSELSNVTYSPGEPITGAKLNSHIITASVGFHF